MDSRKIAAALTLILLASGCSFGSAKPATALANAHIPGAPDELREFGLPDGLTPETFAPRDVNLNYTTNLFMFWRLVNGQVQPSDVESVIDLSLLIQADEDKQFDEIQMNKALVASTFAKANVDPNNVLAQETALAIALKLMGPDDKITAQIRAQVEDATSLKNQLKTETDALNGIENDATNAAAKAADDAIAGFQTQVDQDQAALELDNSKPSTPAIQADIERLNKEITELNGKILAEKQATPTWRKYHAQITPLKTELGEIADVQTISGSALTQPWATWLATNDQIQAVVTECTGYVQGLKPYVMPITDSNGPAMSIHFEPSGAIDMTINSWTPPVGWEQPDGSTAGAPPQFSTADGSIRDVSYTPLGGIFNFTVVTRWATYQFKIGRTHYLAHDTESLGTEHYQGEINLYSDDAPGALRGVAVLDETPQ